MERNLAYLLPENLYRVFNETDLDKRKGALADLWDEDGIFIDPDGVHQGPETISAAVTAMLSPRNMRPAYSLASR